MTQQKGKKERSAARKRVLRIWKTIRPGVALVLSAVMVVLLLVYAVNYVLNHYVRPVDANDTTPIEVVIPNNSSASTIARILYTARGQDEAGLIVSTASFKVYVDFVGKANSLKAGTYLLSRNMSISEIVDILCEGNPARQTVRFTIPEGYSCEAIAAYLEENGIIQSASEFLNLCKDASLFANYDFIAAIDDASDRRYVLEGYLFPDTYEVYTDASCEDILVKMLLRYYEVFTAEDLARAEELGMTRDEVMTLASIIEREAGTDEDFSKVSAVFHNRLAEGMRLESCATLSYVLGVTKYSFTAEEIATVSPYNTYRNDGLPIGPISNPGRAAIEAALYPNEDFLSEGYLYFCNGNPAESKALIFSKTYEEHQQNVEKYSQYWTNSGE